MKGGHATNTPVPTITHVPNLNSACNRVLQFVFGGKGYLQFVEV